MISTESTGDRRLSPSQREALGKFVPNPFPRAQASAPARHPVPVRPPQCKAPEGPPSPSRTGKRWTKRPSTSV